MVRAEGFMTAPARVAFALLASSTVAAAGCGGGGGGGDDTAGVCGDGAVDTGEECDDGNTSDGDGCDSSCAFEPPTAYRADTIALRDPHLFAFGALDVTDTVNGAIADSVTMDADADGNLDLSLVLLFRPVSPAADSSRADAVIGAACAPPAATTMCAADPGSTTIESTATNGDSTCLSPVGGTTGSYTPPITEPAGRCFVTDQEIVAITIGGVALTLQEAQIAATYGTGAPDSLTSGLLSGFMSQAAADATILPEDLPFVGGEALSSLLDAGDRDTGPGGASGWWFYINFTATLVPYTE
jgi:cysteine-rich repeat protein